MWSLFNETITAGQGGERFIATGDIFLSLGCRGQVIKALASRQFNQQIKMDVVWGHTRLTSPRFGSSCGRSEIRPHVPCLLSVWAPGPLFLRPRPTPTRITMRDRPEDSNTHVTLEKTMHGVSVSVRAHSKWLLQDRFNTKHRS